MSCKGCEHLLTGEECKKIPNFPNLVPSDTALYCDDIDAYIDVFTLASGCSKYRVKR